MKRILLIFIIYLISSDLYSIPKISPWDGIAYAIKDYLKENANDPRSIDYIECSYLMEFQNGSYGQRVKFRGKNVYGGLVINEYVFFIKGDDYNAKVFATCTMEEMKELFGDGTLRIVAKYNSEGKKVQD